MTVFTIVYEARAVGSLGWSRDPCERFSTFEVTAQDKEQALEAFDKQRATWYDRWEHIHVHHVKNGKGERV